MFMLKYPMQSLASVVDQVAKKDGEPASAAEVTAPVVEEAPAQEESTTPEAEVVAPVEEVPAQQENVSPEADAIATETESKE
jgi:hypothetical protein